MVQTDDFTILKHLLVINDKRKKFSKRERNPNVQKFRCKMFLRSHTKLFSFQMHFNAHIL